MITDLNVLNVAQRVLLVQEDWRLALDTPAPTASTLLAYGDRAFVEIGGVVYAINATNGVVLAKFSVLSDVPGENPYQTTVPGASLVLSPDGSALLFGVVTLPQAGQAAGMVMVYSLDPATLAQNWSTQITPLTNSPENEVSAAPYMAVAVACSGTIIHVAVADVYLQLAADTGALIGSQVIIAGQPGLYSSPYSNIALSPDNTLVCVVCGPQVQVLNIASGNVQNIMSFQSVKLVKHKVDGRLAEFYVSSPEYTGTISSIVATQSNFIVGWFGNLYLIPFDGGSPMSTQVPFAEAPGLQMTLSITPDMNNIYVTSGCCIAQIDPSTLQSNWTEYLQMSNFESPSNLLVSNSLCYVAPSSFYGAALEVFDSSGQSLTASDYTGKRVYLSTGNPEAGFEARAVAGPSPLLAAAGADRLLMLSGNVLVAAGLAERPLEDLADTRLINGPGPWMALMSRHIGEKPLRQIRIPGSHDSGTYNITSESPIGMDASPLAEPGKTIDAVAPWAKAQGLNFLEQLNAGIRYLDLRVQDGECGYEITHSMISVGLNQLFEQLEEFYANWGNVNEIIILDFQSLFGFASKADTEYLNEYEKLCKAGMSSIQAIVTIEMKPTTAFPKMSAPIPVIYEQAQRRIELARLSRMRMQMLIDTVCKRIGQITPAGTYQITPADNSIDNSTSTNLDDGATPFLIPVSLGLSVTPNQIWNGPGRIMIIWDDDGNTDFAANPFLWPRSSTLTSPWANVNNVPDLKEKLSGYLNETHNNFFVLQGVLTPNINTIGSKIFDSIIPDVVKSAVSESMSYIISKFAFGGQHFELLKSMIDGAKPFTSLEDMASSVNPQLTDWLTTEWLEKPVNIVIADWVNLSRYIPAVIALNEIDLPDMSIKKAKLRTQAMARKDSLTGRPYDLVSSMENLLKGNLTSYKAAPRNQPPAQ